MNPAIALAKVGVQKHQRITLTLIAGMILGQVLFWSLLSVRAGETTLMITLIGSLAPYALGVFLLSDWSTSVDTQFGSAPSSWLLRQPLTTGQIVTPMVVMATGWIAMGWGLMAFCLVQGIGLVQVPVIPPILGGAAILFGTLGVGARPYAKHRYRLLAFAALIALVFGGFAFQTRLLTVGQPGGIRDRLGDAADGVAIAVSVVAYGVAIGLLWHGVDFSRRETDRWQGSSVGSWGKRLWPISGLVPKSSDARALADHQTRRLTAAPFSPWRGLYRYEKRRHRGSAILATMGCSICGPAAAMLFHPSPVFIVILVATGSVAAMSAVHGRQAARPGGGTHVMDPLRAGSPVSSATLAWSRLAAVLTSVISVYALLLVPLIVWWIQPRSRVEWTLLVERGGGGPIVWAWMTLVSVGLFGRAIATDFCDRFGKISIALTLVFVGCAGYLVAIGVAVAWLTRQSDYDAAMSSLLAMTRWLMPMLATACAIKMIVVLGVGWWSNRRGLYRWWAFAGIFGVWGLVFSGTAAVAWPLTTLLVNDRVILGPGTLLMGVALILPLARPLMYPLATSFHRHR